jgi:hypothetical protein
MKNKHHGYEVNEIVQVYIFGEWQNGIIAKRYTNHCFTYSTEEVANSPKTETFPRWSNTHTPYDKIRPLKKGGQS